MYIGILLDDPRPPVRHVTLTFHDHNESKEAYKGAVAALAQCSANWYSGPITLEFGDMNIFEPSGAWHTKVKQTPELMAFQKNLTVFLDARQVAYSKEYDYVPHVTLTYFKKPKKNPFEGLTFEAKAITVVSNEFGNTDIRL